VKIPRGPATVREEFLQECHCSNMGRQEVMLTLEPGDLPVFTKLCERQKKVLFAYRFTGSLSCLEIMGLFLYKKKSY
jgi:hypothetical protein